MRLLIEIGNTRVKWALADERGRLTEPVALRHGHPAWTEQLPDVAAGAVWYASVACPQVHQPLLDWASSREVSAPRRIFSSAHAGGVTNAYSEPGRLGVDRLLACVAAHRRYPGRQVLVADAGTALTVDHVDADGGHQGGMICPGVTTMRHAIRADTQVRAQDLAPQAELLGRDTDTAVAQGTLQAALALLERVRALRPAASLLVTGGEAPLLMPHLGDRWEMAPALVLEGLELLSRGSGS